jgi:chromosome segregation ATPase
LSQDSEQAKSKFQEKLARSNKQLVDVRRSLQAKIAALHQEKDASLLELQKYEASVRNFECVVENKNESISSLQQGNDDLEKRISTLIQDSDQAKATLQEEISMFEKQLVEVKRSLHAKITALHEGNDATILKLHESQASVRNFENVIEQQNEEFSSLQQANDKLQKTIYTLIKESEQGKAKLQEEVARLDKQLVDMRRSLHAKIAALHEDKDATLLQLQESQASSKNFESVIEVQNEKIPYLQQNNDELQKIIWTLTEESEQNKAKLQDDLNDMTIKNIAWLENQLVEMRTFHSKIVVLHREKDATLLKLHASQALVKNSESVVEQHNEKISCLQQDKDELQKIIYTLTLELDQAKAKFQEEVSRLDK